MLKKTLLIDSYELEQLAEELGYEYEIYFPIVQELDATGEDGCFIQEYKKAELKEYKKYHSKMAIEILEKFFDKHQVQEFIIVAAY